MVPLPSVVLPAPEAVALPYTVPLFSVKVPPTKTLPSLPPVIPTVPAMV